jgi:hypothetical protein
MIKGVPRNDGLQSDHGIQRREALLLEVSQQNLGAKIRRLGIMTRISGRSKR